MKNKIKRELIWTFAQILLVIMMICIGTIGLVLIIPIVLIERYCISSFDENTEEG